jgi:hypothetical protein
MNHVAKLPTAIFQVVQEYSQQKDYRQLINSNSAAFKTVKQETAYYALKLSGNKEDRLRSIVSIIDFVKDKSKQITLTLSNLDQPTVINYAHSFRGIEKLSLDGSQKTFDNHLSFNMFGNIHFLSLKGIKGISEVHFCLEITEKLELLNCDFEEIIGWKPSNRLKELIITYCDKLIAFPNVSDIPIVTLTTLSEQLNRFQVGGQTKLTFDGKALTLETLEHIASQPTSFFDSLTRLQIRCPNFPKEFQDYSVFQNITALYLIINSGFDEITQSQCFPGVFTGQQLGLSYFNLSQWSGALFVNLERCELFHCYNLVHLPEMPRIAFLFVEGCTQLEIIPPFPLLRDLTISSCYAVKSVSVGSQLKRLQLDRCEVLKELFGLENIESLKIRRAYELKKIPMLKKIEYLELFLCEKLLSVEVLNVGSAVPDNWKRNFFLDSLKSLQHVTFCTFLCRLHLGGIAKLKNLEGISNVKNLMIQDCPNLVSTEGVGNIALTFAIYRCDSLVALTGLKNVPFVTIQSCLEVSDFNGLGNHLELQVINCHHFDVFVEEYQKEKKHEEIFKTIKVLKKR